MIDNELIYLFFRNQFLASDAGEAASIFEDLQSGLSTQQGEMVAFAKELKQVRDLTCTVLHFQVLVALEVLIKFMHENLCCASTILHSMEK